MVHFSLNKLLSPGKKWQCAFSRKCAFLDRGSWVRMGAITPATRGARPRTCSRAARIVGLVAAHVALERARGGALLAASAVRQLVLLAYLRCYRPLKCPPPPLFGPTLGRRAGANRQYHYPLPDGRDHAHLSRRVWPPGGWPPPRTATRWRGGHASRRLRHRIAPLCAPGAARRGACGAASAAGERARRPVQLPTPSRGSRVCHVCCDSACPMA